MESAQIIRYLTFAASAMCGIVAVAAAVAARKQKSAPLRKRLILLSISSFYLGTVIGLAEAGILHPRLIMPLLLLYAPFVIWRQIAMRRK